MENNSRQRHGFVSFWLWLSVIASAVMLIYTLYISYTLSLVFSSGDFTLHTIWPCVAAFCTLGGYLLLLCWKRRGFLVLLTVELCTVINNLFVASQVDPAEITAIYSIQSFIAPMVRILVLFLILQIKKNGVSYWEAMSSDVQSQPIAPQPPQLPQQLQQPKPPQQQYAPGPYCPQCGSRNLETSKFCTECGTALKSSISPVAPPPPVPQATDMTATEDSVTDTAEVSQEITMATSPKQNNRIWVWLIIVAICLLGGLALLFTGTSDDLESPEDYYSLAEFEGDLTSEVVTEEPSVEEYPTTGFHYGYEWVDLGLSTGLKWATCNVGASSPEDFGGHFAWGELKSVESGNTKARLNGETNKEDSFDISGSWAYDAARVNWGGYWRIPSSDEWEELISECIWRWVTKNGVDGYEVTGLTGKSIFLPAADLGRNGFGYYWSSTGVTNPFAADHIAFGNEFLKVSPWGGRDSGMTIRPVYSKDTYLEEPIPSSDTFYRKGVLSVNGVIYPMAYVDGDGIDFYIGKYEVTQELWEEVMGTDVIEQRNMTNPKWSLRGVGDDYPMYYVNYYEAVEFCNKLEQLTGRKFSLPTESQWEYAATGGQYGYGDYSGEAWYKDNSGGTTHEVGSKQSNEIGLYDMCGNVREWCDGWDGSKRALRGGGWYNGEDEVNVTRRYFDGPEVRDNNYGFRICLEL